MGMFDDVEPGDVPCPVCGLDPQGWQTKDGKCMLTAITLGDDMQKHGIMEPEGLFTFYDHDENDHWIEVAGVIHNHIWVTSFVYDVYQMSGPRKNECLWNIRNTTDRWMA